MRRRNSVAVVAATGMVLVASVRGFTRRFAVREDSMTPELQHGDWIIARRRTSALERGDVVVSGDPVTGMQLVKRIIGLPGERIAIERGHVTINGAFLADRWAHGITAPDGVWDVPGDHVWLLGDNRAVSRGDGRETGPIPVSSIPWVVVGRYWPPGRTGLVS